MTTTAASPDLSTPGAIFELGTAFCTAKCLLTALEVGLFTELDAESMTRQQLCDRLALHPRGMRDFLSVLVALGLLDKDGEHYRNSAAAAHHLVRDKPSYIGGFLERSNHMLYPAWGKFTHMLRTGEPTADADYMEMIKDPRMLRRFLGMMDALTGLIGPELAGSFEWGAYRSMVDIGGARGNLAASVVTVHPHLQGGVFDLPEMQEPFSEHMAELGLAGQLRFHPGNFFTDDLPTADVLTIGHVLHDWSDAECRHLVRKAYDAIAPGGALVVYDRMLDEECTDLTNLIISLDMMLTTPGGAEYTVSEYQGWLVEAGFGDISARPLGEHDTMLVGYKAR